MVGHEEEAAGLLQNKQEVPSRASIDSNSSASTTSLVFERIEEQNRSSGAAAGRSKGAAPYANRVGSSSLDDGDEKDDQDLENGPFITATKDSRSCTKLVWILGGIFIGAWALATIIFLSRHPSPDAPHDPNAPNVGNGKLVTLPQVMTGEWRAKRHGISWIQGANGEDGLLLEQNASGKDYLIVEDVRGDNATEANTHNSLTLMQKGSFQSGDEILLPNKVWPSKDLKHVLIATNVETNWRHSFYARYWIFDVASQTAQPLDPTNVHDRVQLASWSPQSDAIVFTRDNNMFLRKLSSPTVIQITTDGSKDLFYGIPDWVYEEEVFSGNSATWWAEDGKYIAFLKTDESEVPEYPIQYFVKRPSGTKAAPGEESYPEVREIKYPKAGAPNPTVSLRFYDVTKGDVFEVKISDEFADDNRLITEVVWAGSTGKAIIRETNRESDVLRVVLVDVLTRTGRTVRTDKVAEVDGGWFEVSQQTRYIPADPSNGRPQDGYIDTIIHENNDHLAYFTPLDNAKPILLTSGDWEVVTAPSAVDLKKNLVYFVSTKESPIQRHIYSVKLDGTDLKPLTDTSKEGYYDGSFSSGAGYVLLSYEGPSIPWQRVVSTPSNSNSYEKIIEENPTLDEMAKKHDLPTNIYSTVTIDGFELQVVERRPPHFDKHKKYPVLFHLYGGPGSQTVNKKFAVDFQAYVAANLGYIVVTVDGRGTGYIGREARCIIRGNIGYWESRDQIETAKIWAAKPYVDSSRLAIWGWSYGGFMTLKTLERDAGQTFKYGMAVAPVTDWRYYDSIYTERYMHRPQENEEGYDNATISDVASLGQNVRFLLMHGVADDNVHMQNSLALIDRLDLGGVENYDVHVFPDSDHGIYFHNANMIVYDSKYLEGEGGAEKEMKRLMK
jgi:dipeptidyl aminopeptidase